jgi:hypothetical protein
MSRFHAWNGFLGERLLALSRLCLTSDVGLILVARSTNSRLKYTTRIGCYRLRYVCRELSCKLLRSDGE